MTAENALSTSQKDESFLDEYFQFKFDEFTEKARIKISRRVAKERAIVVSYLNSSLKKEAFANSVGVPLGTFRHICERYPELTIRSLSRAEENRVSISNSERSASKLLGDGIVSGEP